MENVEEAPPAPRARTQPKGRATRRQRTAQGNKLRGQLLELLSRFRVEDVDDTFDYPADELADVLPGYREKVSTPMDFLMIEGKVKKGKYDSIDAFRADCELVVNNCMAYHPNDSQYHKEAESMKKYMDTQFHLAVHGDVPRPNRRRRAKFSAAEENLHAYLRESNLWGCSNMKMPNGFAEDSTDTPETPKYPYETIDRYLPVATADPESINKKLSTSQVRRCDGGCCDSLEKLGPFDHGIETFKTACPCRRARSECNQYCGCTSQSCKNRPISQCERKLKDIDVETRVTYGFDPFSKTRMIAEFLVRGMPADTVNSFFDNLLIALNDYKPWSRAKSAGASHSFPIQLATAKSPPPPPPSAAPESDSRSPTPTPHAAPASSVALASSANEATPHAAPASSVAPGSSRQEASATASASSTAPASSSSSPETQSSVVSDGEASEASFSSATALRLPERGLSYGYPFSQLFDGISGASFLSSKGSVIEMPPPAPPSSIPSPPQPSTSSHPPPPPPPYQSTDHASSSSTPTNGAVPDVSFRAPSPPAHFASSSSSSSSSTRSSHVVANSSPPHSAPPAIVGSTPPHVASNSSPSASSPHFPTPRIPPPPPPGVPPPPPPGAPPPRSRASGRPVAPPRVIGQTVAPPSLSKSSNASMLSSSRSSHSSHAHSVSQTPDTSSPSVTPPPGSRASASSASFDSSASVVPSVVAASHSPLTNGGGGGGVSALSANNTSTLPDIDTHAMADDVRRKLKKRKHGSPSPSAERERLRSRSISGDSSVSSLSEDSSSSVVTVVVNPESGSRSSSVSSLSEDSAVGLSSGGGLPSFASTGGALSTGSRSASVSSLSDDSDPEVEVNSEGSPSFVMSEPATAREGETVRPKKRAKLGTPGHSETEDAPAPRKRKSPTHSRSPRPSKSSASKKQKPSLEEKETEPRQKFTPSMNGTDADANGVKVEPKKVEPGEASMEIVLKEEEMKDDEKLDGETPRASKHEKSGDFSVKREDETACKREAATSEGASEKKAAQKGDSSPAAAADEEKSAEEAPRKLTEIPPDVFTVRMEDLRRQNQGRSVFLPDVLMMIVERADDFDERCRTIAEHMLFKLLMPEERDPVVQYDADAIGAAAASTVVYRKGLGMVCVNKAGFKPSELIVEYFGEVYPPWRYYEKEEALKAAEKKLQIPKHLPDFFNITLERHKDDPAGYDVLFVDPIRKGTFGSRLSHSCKPNCHTTVMCVNGRYVIGVYTLKQIKFGEELTFDYASVTESQDEWEKAICLCSSDICRGSFLDFAGSTAFQHVMRTDHNLLHRVAFVIRASTEELTADDMVLIRKAGIGSSILDGLPRWAHKWIALAVEFIEFERRVIPSRFVRDKLQNGQRAYTPESAELEAMSVYHQRLGDIAVTMDRVKYFLSKPRNDKHRDTPPLRYLAADEMVERLWSGQGSVLSFFVSKMEEQDPDHFRGNYAHFWRHIERVNPSHDEEGLKQIRESFLWFRDELRKLRPTKTAFHHAAADVFHLYANTRFFFTDNEYKGFSDVPFTLAELGFKNHKGSSIGKKMSSQYIWGSLAFWMRQTIEKPDASLSQNRRGIVSLPNIQCCFAKRGEHEIRRKYTERRRSECLNLMRNRQHTYWPTSMHWSFDNRKTYGTPLLDNILVPDAERMERVLSELEAWDPYAIYGDME